MVLCFCGLLVLTRWIAKHVQGIGYLLTEDGGLAMTLYFMLMFPGVVLHELSHAIVAWLLRVRVRRLSLGIRRKGRSRQISLGSVDIARTGPIRASLIGLAPLVAGCAAILWISNQVLGIRSLPPFGEPGFWQALKTVYNVTDFWLWIYLVMAVGNAMLPSAADRQAWGTALIFIAFVAVLLYFSGLLGGISLALAQWAGNGASQLTYAFAVTVIVDLIFAVLVFAAEQTLGLLGFGRVQYH
jgi:hypothetical protein